MLRRFSTSTSVLPSLPIRPGRKRSPCVFAQVGGGGINNPALAAQLDQVAREYGVGEVNFHGANHVLDRLVNVPDFPKVDRAVDAAALAEIRGHLAVLKRRGLKVTISGPEPILPDDFFDKYPEARDVSNGLLWKYSENRTAEVFRRVPGDGLHRVSLLGSAPAERFELISASFTGPTLPPPFGAPSNTIRPPIT